jgi:ABC transport system ATP-binding/permease protein
MSLLINCQAIGKSHGARPLFAGLSLAFFADERLGLIGPNGAGKSTLLKILAGLIEPDQGEVSIRRGTRLAYLPQEDCLDPGLTIEQTLLNAIAELDLSDAERYGRVNRWLAQAGFDDPDQRVSELSGGWRKRLAIAAVFCSEADLLLLDEPTNHLDIQGIMWLETLLLQLPSAFILVTHDRYMLENVTGRIAEINPVFPEGYLKAEGGYSEFIFHREAFLNQQVQLEAVLANKARRETEWLRRGPKARTTKARFRIEEAYRLRDELRQVRTCNRQQRRVDIDFDATGRKTRKLLTATGISASVAGKALFKNLDITLSPSSCLGLAGDNGSGKTTLVEILAGRRQPDSGRIQTADGVKTVVFDQNRSRLDLEATLREALSPAGESLIYQGKTVHVASWAKRFLFRPEQLDLPIGQLSGGEQARILIAELMRQPADVLILDEPTNDLDIPSLEILEEGLSDFPGAVVLVTHDRFLMDRLVTQVVGLDENGGGLYADLSQWIVAKTDRTPKEKAVGPAPKPQLRVKKRSYLEQRELDGIEAKILEAEAALGACQALLAQDETTGDPERLRACCQRLQSCQEDVDRLYRRWEELESSGA